MGVKLALMSLSAVADLGALSSPLTIASAAPQASPQASPQGPALELASDVELERLSRAKIWRLLLHYEEGLLGGASRSDGEAFFLSEERSPLSELKADLKAMLTPPAPQAAGSGADETQSERSHQHNQHFRCRFPARARWLSEQLKLPELPQLSCPERDEFIKEMDIHGLELLYASASFSQSASMFGHTMLRVMRGPQQDPLQDPVISFVAYVTARGIWEVIYGLTGQFAGVIEVANLSQQVINYTVKERRNLWSLKLKVPPEGLRRLVEHLWEMNSTFFRYHFFDENCAFYNQGLLQLALPEHALRDEMSLISLPLEAVYALTERHGLVERVSFYPSAAEVFEAGWAELSGAERSLVTQLARAPQALSLPPARAALVYKTALNMSLINTYREELKVSDEERAPSAQLSALLASTGLDPQLVAPDYTTPLIGAGAHTLSVGGGARWGGAPIVELELRPMLHDREENPLSYGRYNEITLLKTRARYQPLINKLELNQLTLGSIYNLRPWTLSGPLSSAPSSWAFDLGLRDASRLGREGLDAYLELEWGLTLPIGSFGGLSLMLGPVAEWTIGASGRAGAHSFAQLALYPLDRVTLSARLGTRLVDWSSPSLETREDYAEASLNLFISRSLTLNLKARASQIEASREAVLDLRYHWF